MTPSSPDPTSRAKDIRVEPFDPEVHISPHRLFRRLKDAAAGEGAAPVLVDLRASSEGRVRFRDELLADLGPHPLGPPLPRSGEGEVELEGPLCVLVDDDGIQATQRARELRDAGHEKVYALYGGMELYDYALDRLVVGAERFLTEPSPLAPRERGDRGG